ncbi:MAG: HD domain-containing protein [Candidatus Acididesulfobacter diazotrophicus]|jgi:dGTP triphosphohydrolase|uniref:HD domain-containing protein n=1 Tax=Candidatus Acididesulfobacter diazotrophicus TaxID=2597226 RepID=A0A519BJV8_9DELT|nr:MAG: HD domain-containing protein [Candidatus Acididesulfobacter diazotrophicus]
MAGNLKSLEDFKTSGKFKEQIDAILNLGFFRKLAGKTQVILSLAGPAVRTRLTHTVEVARITRKLCDKLGLNSGLGEAIALAHDLGHTPFGHVGERALKEISCGCDTLKGKVNETDFDNSGFKHNLQSFRVLSTLEPVRNNGSSDKKWPYILWGVSAHSSMTWNKSHVSIENDMLISCEQCNRVYSCFYHEKKECKRNIFEKREIKKEGIGKKALLCRPSFCAGLDKYKNKYEIPEDLLNAGDKKEDYLGYFKNEERYPIYCLKPCYLSDLAAHKMKIENKEIVNMFTYLFDHPFPNSFYAPHFFHYFSGGDFVSVEAQVVHQADEIAQRQQDLEDAVSMGLITFEKAIKDVKSLVCGIKIKNADKYRKKIKNVDNQKKLGKIIVDFYSDCLYETTFKNFEKFLEKKCDIKSNTNIYSLINLLFVLDNNEEGRNNWIIEEINNFPNQKPFNYKLKKLIEIFGVDIKHDKKYFYFLILDILNDYKYSNYAKCLDILSKFINLTEIEKIKPDNMPMPENCMEVEQIKRLIYYIDELGKKIQEKFEYKKYYGNDNHLRDLRDFNLYPFYILYCVLELRKKEKKDGYYFTINGLLNSIDDETLEKECKDSFSIRNVFKIWIKKLKTDATNSILAGFVQFADEKYNEKEFSKFKEFSDKQKNYILKSELIEKSDGKANYILKRLFNAFIADAHQLPDDGLIFIIIAMNDDRIINKFIDNEKETFIKIIMKLEKTTIDKGLFKEKLNKINNISDFTKNDFKIKLSNEIDALYKKREHLRSFYHPFNLKRKKLKHWIVSRKYNDSLNMIDLMLEFRGILDNPILNSMPYWRSILTRGICDYIASLTDEEAIEQYEKLYAGVMELG